MRGAVSKGGIGALKCHQMARKRVAGDRLARLHAKCAPLQGPKFALYQFRSPGARQNRPSFHEKHATSLSQRDAASNAIKQLRFVPGLKRCNRVADCHDGKTFLVVVLRSNREGVTSSIPITPTIQSPQTTLSPVDAKK